MPTLPHPTLKSSTEILKAPFPWFGGKSRVASLVWDRFGNCPNYIEPFAGSLAVLLGRPHDAKNETVNDKDCFLANFWRSVTHDPAAVAAFADWPVNEADLSARHQWLVDNSEFQERMKTEPDYFNPKVAGWWVWGISIWIGSGWCSRPEWRGRGNGSRAARGIHRQRPSLNPWMGVSDKRPLLGKGGVGVHRKLPRQDNTGVHRQIPHISGSGGQGVFSERASDLEAYMCALSDRLRSVRVCCGDWARITGPSPTTKIGLTGVFLDPPYSVDDRDDVYNEESKSISHEVRQWAIEHADDPLMRIALCGYDSEHGMPADWECIHWKANGGYANQENDQTAGKNNATRERIWFSPHCLKTTLFSFEDFSERPSNG
jgi:site-specific DNA-adenine methylase